MARGGWEAGAWITRLVAAEAEPADTEEPRLVPLASAARATLFSMVARLERMLSHLRYRNFNYYFYSDCL